jgi:signal transduction histidine kinase
VLAAVATDLAAGIPIVTALATQVDALRALAGADVAAVVPCYGAPVLARAAGVDSDLERRLLAVFRPGARPLLRCARLTVSVAAGGEPVAILVALRRGDEPFTATAHSAFKRIAALGTLDPAGRRRQLAHRLHDEVAQILYAARLGVERTLEDGELSPAAASALARVTDLIAEGDRALRTVVDDLATDKALGLPARVAAVADEVAALFGNTVDVDISPAGDAAARDLDTSITELLARVAREALINAAKHAGPCQLEVRLTAQRNRLRLTVVDDGFGLQPGRGYGLAALRRSVRSHGATLLVHGPATGGTMVSVSLPVARLDTRLGEVTA